MVFSSQLFLFWFLPLSLFMYYAGPRRMRHLSLTVASYVFYGWANPLFTPLLFASTVVDYACGLVMGRYPRYRTPALVVSVGAGLGLLAFFKYFNFVVDTANGVAEAFGAPALGVSLRVVLPLGISFYTFQSMSYTIDVYRGHVAPIRRFVDFACFVSMFPQLVAGPIVRFAEVAEQLRHREHTVTKFARGATFVAVGLAKKVLVANPCGAVADAAFGAGSLSTADAWYGALAYAFQIYFDFSAYSDMAIGLGLMFGFVFPKNFDSPYLAASITEFWRRWHISLSTFLRDYLYVPLGGNRRGAVRTYVNVMLVMLLGGLWHGAGWTFVAWGGLHGAMLAYERWRGRGSWYDALPRALRVAATFALVVVSWVFFRASDLPSAFGYLSVMLLPTSGTGGGEVLGALLYQPYAVATMTVAAVIVWMCPQTWDWTRRLSWPKAVAALALFAAAAGVLSTQAYNPFIYFIF